MQDIKATIQRFYEATGTSTVAELAEALNVKRQAVYSAMKNKKIPWEWYFRASEKENYSTDWLYSGNGPKVVIFFESQQDSENVVCTDEKIYSNNTLQFDDNTNISKRSVVSIFDKLLSSSEGSNNSLVLRIKEFAYNLDA